MVRSCDIDAFTDTVAFLLWFSSFGRHDGFEEVVFQSECNKKNVLTRIPPTCTGFLLEQLSDANPEELLQLKDAVQHYLHGYTP